MSNGKQPLLKYLGTFIGTTIVLLISAVLASITGHAALRGAGHTAYAEWNTGSVAKVGAVGGALATPVFSTFVIITIYILSRRYPDPNPNTEAGRKQDSSSSSIEHKIFILVFFLLVPATGAISAAAGSAILRACNYNVITVSLAARSGAVGGVFLAPAFVVGYMVLGCCGLLFLSYLLSS